MSKLKRYFEDSDGRVRTSYLISGTESFRTSTNLLDPPVRKDIYGLSFHTINKHSEEGKDIRSIFVPEEGYCFLEVDKSQAEHRVALFLGEEYENLRLMDELDSHVLTASWITERTYEQELAIYKAGDDFNRQIGKHSTHANDNGVGKRRLVELIDHHSNHQIHISEWKAGEILKVIDGHVGGVRAVFHKGIQDQLAIDRTLVCPYGRKRTFYNRWGDEVFKEAYADIKQFTVIASLQLAAMEIRKRIPTIRILLEWHDSLLFELPVWRLDEYIPIIKEEFERPIDFSNCSLSRGQLVIPCEMKVGYESWDKMVKL